MHVDRSKVKKGFAALRAIRFQDVEIRNGFWAPRLRANREGGLRHGYVQLEKAGNFHDLKLAAGMASGEGIGKVFRDSDVYKWLEAIAYELAKEDSAELRRMADEAIDLIEKAQSPDGYLNSHFQVGEPERRWQDLSRGHELYCAGHLFEAALAFRRLLGDDRLFNVAVRFADHIDGRFGPGKVAGTPGHPEIELALIELYRETGSERYLRLAKYFIDERGKGLLDWGPNTGHNGPSDLQDHLPIRDSSSLEGHAVRQLYLNCGVTDLYLETGEQALLDSMLRQWENMVSAKLYVTGGLGSRHLHEAFSEPYELPNSRAYCETCAAIADIMWSWRLLLATGEGRFADLIEHTLYNAFLSGVSLGSTLYFYCNPLLSLGATPYASRKRIERMEWPWTPCCPPNVMRTFALLPHFIATANDDGIQIHQYISASLTGEIEGGKRVALSIGSGLPWTGETSITIESEPQGEWTLALRIPAWANGTTVRVGGKPVDARAAVKGYLSIKRSWKKGDRVELGFPVDPHFVEGNPLVDSVYQSLAIKRGPVVFCLEQVDQEEGVDVLHARVDEDEPVVASFEPELLGGVMTVRASGRAGQDAAWRGSLYRRFEPSKPGHAAGTSAATSPGRKVSLTAIPYFAWANRGPNAMRVWLPRYHGG